MKNPSALERALGCSKKELVKQWSLIAASTLITCELVRTWPISSPTTRTAELQERMASIAWAIRIATLSPITITISQVITFVSSYGVNALNRAQSKTTR
ncbi:hypothetical protein IVB41_25255 [Bradyrhizobium sp. 44]|jgi:hypothetical protein|uniref:hypothetical protein n=1 Tax=unclassified Bradyrhizobium TaxID=2631580 RepID=UPI0012DD8D1A|nr:MULTISPECIES: hypothetical protein [unclassified Bradyrhizobium]MCK1287222.1 hypothetical protein [Bradyrhizobium sp. 44]